MAAFAASAGYSVPELLVGDYAEPTAENHEINKLINKIMLKPRGEQSSLLIALLNFFFSENEKIEYLLTELELINSSGKETNISDKMDLGVLERILGGIISSFDLELIDLNRDNEFGRLANIISGRKLPISEQTFYVPGNTIRDTYELICTGNPQLYVKLIHRMIRFKYEKDGDKKYYDDKIDEIQKYYKHYSINFTKIMKKYVEDKKVEQPFTKGQFCNPAAFHRETTAEQIKEELDLSIKYVNEQFFVELQEELKICFDEVSLAEFILELKTIYETYDSSPSLD